MKDTIRIGNREFKRAGKTYVMGILNVTPDSFSDGGKFADPDAAIAHVAEMIEDGADLIDVGGESTRPGATEIGVDEELRRVIPVIERIKARFDIPVSIDTYHAKVAEEAIKRGADLLNDVWGGKNGSFVPQIAAASGCPIVLMHNRTNFEYGNFFRDIQHDLEESVEEAVRIGVARERILVDPGIGFAKDANQNLTVLHRLEVLHRYGVPILLGVSRKSVLGAVLNLPVEERTEGTLAATVLAVAKGVQFVRVHDVRANLRAIRMTEAILREKV